MTNLKIKLIKISLSVVIGTIAYGYFVEPYFIEIKRVVIHSEKLGSVLKGQKVVQLSDLQMSKFGKREKRIIKILEKLDPDIVFFTGDYIGYGSSFEPVVKFLEKVPAKIGIWAVLGNSDYSNEAGSCILCHEAETKILKKANRVKFLRNSAELVEISSAPHPAKFQNEKSLAIIGLDDLVTGRADLDQSLENVSNISPKILLSHSPDVFEEAVTRKIDLVLSGHTHGGQLFFASFVKKFLGNWDSHNLRYLQGFYQADGTIMYVNRGLGTSMIPLRIGVRPEITVFEFN